MHVRAVRLLPALALALLGACKSDPTKPDFYETPLPASLEVGDLVRLNVNGEENCTNGIYHIARVVAIGEKSMIFADTLNPAGGGFTPADYQRYAAKFDTLVYPLDVGAFGAPTDIDNNGRVGIIFTRAVNELTPPGSDSYVGGFTYSRDLFPKTGNGRADACETSNEGEYFYALAPDPQGAINGNKRTTGFVDSATISVLAHELQHLINASRRLYINTAAEEFEDKWLDEGLAHIAEELLFYRESSTAPRTNLDVPKIQQRNAIVNAFNNDMIGNAGRYRSYLVATQSSSPYADDDELETRGAAWNWLRYLADQKITNATRSPAAAIERSGPGTVSVPGLTAGAEYYATLVNSTLVQIRSADYSISAGGVVAPTLSLTPAALPSLSRTGSLASLAAERQLTMPQRDVRFEARLRTKERSLGPARMARAREWYRDEIPHMEVPQGGRYSVAPDPFPTPDGDIWMKLANNPLVGIANAQQIFGLDLSLAVSDWSASHAVDDVSSLVGDQFLQKSWNWHSIFDALDGTSAVTYPLVVRTMVTGTAYSGTLNAGSSTHFRFAVPANGTATLTVNSTSGEPAAGGLRLLVVRTK
jgi:hypothetical protein